MTCLEQMRESRIVPVVVLDQAEDAVATADALIAGGVSVMEITMRTDAALKAIENVAVHCPKMLVGAGTVKNLQQCKLAVAAGAKFTVSPGFSKEIVSYCRGNQIPCLPGCVTATEIMEAMELGVRVIKFFPANIYGGISAMKALSAPFGEISFIPTGGVNEKNVKEYLDQPFIWAVGGSWICTKQDIKDKNFDKITKLCIQARE